MHRRASLLVVALLIAGCSSNDGNNVDTPSGSDSSTTTPKPDLGQTNGSLAPPLTLFNESYDFVVTYASPSKGLGTNFGQQNCVGISDANILNGTATLTWTPDASSAELELVATSFSGPSPPGEQRLTGGSPLSISFAFNDTGDQVVVSVQSPQTGAVQQLPVHLVVQFQHAPNESPAAVKRLCAF